MKKFLITGGIEKPQRNDEWSGFKSALALELDIESGSCKQVLEYFTPKNFRPAEPACSVLFKSGEVQGDKVILTTQTEVLVYQWPQYKLLHRISLPCFNDIHHARLTDKNSILVCITGLDSVFEVTLRGEVINEWSTTGEGTWQRFDKSKDYRQVLTTKPHSSHPNFCFEYAGEFFVTRFKCKDAISLQSDKCFNIAIGGPHDGFVLGKKVYFTTVNGYVIAFDLETTEQVLMVNLNDFNDSSTKNLGWCRSLYMLNESEAIIGFSRMRTSKFSDYLSWAKGKVGVGTANALATRVVQYNFSSKTINWSVNLEKHQMNAVFSVLALPK